MQAEQIALALRETAEELHKAFETNRTQIDLHDIGSILLRVAEKITEFHMSETGS